MAVGVSGGRDNGVAVATGQGVASTAAVGEMAVVAAPPQLTNTISARSAIAEIKPLDPKSRRLW